VQFMARSKYKPDWELKVKRSKSGLGLFTCEEIPRDKVVAEYFGEIISSDEADRRGGKYLFEISSRRTIDGSARINKARYINHSCRPNCETDVISGKVFIFAKRKIREGEELTYDYGKEYWKEYIGPKLCRCDKCNEKKSDSKNNRS